MNRGDLLSGALLCRGLGGIEPGMTGWMAGGYSGTRDRNTSYNQKSRDVAE